MGINLPTSHHKGTVVSDQDLARHVNENNPHSDYVQKSLATEAGDIFVRMEDGSIGVLHPDEPGYALFYMQNNPTTLQWLPIESVLLRLLKNKGDLLTSDGVGHLVVIPVGTASQVLTPNPDVNGGLEWVDLVDVCPARLDFSYACDSQYLGAL